MKLHVLGDPSLSACCDIYVGEQHPMSVRVNFHGFADLVQGVFGGYEEHFQPDYSAFASGYRRDREEGTDTGK